MNAHSTESNEKVLAGFPLDSGGDGHFDHALVDGFKGGGVVETVDEEHTAESDRERE